MKIACKYIKYNPITVNPLNTGTNISKYSYTVSKTVDVSLLIISS